MLALSVALEEGPWATLDKKDLILEAQTWSANLMALHFLIYEKFCV